jgi:glycosyltransferase involved in cell wall biosynthesis
MKQVMHIRTVFEPGGTENLILNLFNVSNPYFSIHLVLLNGGSLTEDLDNRQNSVKVLKRERKIDFKVLRLILEIIKINKIEIIHTHQLIELIYAVLIKIRKPRVKLVHHIHLYTDKKNWEFYLEKIICQYWVEKVISVSNTLLKNLIKKGYSAKNLTVLLNPIHLRDSKSSLEAEKEFTELINYTKEDRVIGMIGNFREEKDQATLVKGFLLLYKKYPSLKLVLIGELNAFSDKVKLLVPAEIINSRIYFTGQVKNAQSFLQFWKIFIFSTYNETFGIAALEAVSKKIAVIASDIDVMKELSENSAYFKLFKTGNENDLAEAIQKELIEPTPDKKLEEASSYVNTKFGMINYIEKLNLIYGA